MKKIVSVALMVVAFGLVGCSAQKTDYEDSRDYNIAEAQSKCRTVECGKLGKLGANAKKDINKQFLAIYTKKARIFLAFLYEGFRCKIF